MGTFRKASEVDTGPQKLEPENKIEQIDFYMFDDSDFYLQPVYDYIERVDDHISWCIQQCHVNLENLRKHNIEDSEALSDFILLNTESVIDVHSLIDYLCRIDKLSKSINKENIKTKKHKSLLITFDANISNLIILNKEIVISLKKCSHAINNGVSLLKKNKLQLNSRIKQSQTLKKSIDNKLGKTIRKKKAQNIKSIRRLFQYKELKERLQDKIDTQSGFLLYRYTITDKALLDVTKKYCIDRGVETVKSGKGLPHSKNMYHKRILDYSFEYLRDRIPTSALVKNFKFKSLHTFRRYLKRIVIAHDKKYIDMGNNLDLIIYLLNYYKEKKDGKRSKNMYFTRLMVDDFNCIYKSEETRKRLFMKSVSTLLDKKLIVHEE